ncbi:hypothetical protein BJ912DRAFT_1085824 [Pholiota molesta]|nr:hypothetical protein BJ912DRAFT_1085824 [Pholiota molesta]
MRSAHKHVIDELTPSVPDFQLRDACDQLLHIMVETQEMQVQLVSSHVMLAILEVLEGRCSRDVIIKLLQIIIFHEDLGFLESFCLTDVIFVITSMEFTSKKYPSECRLEAWNFIRLLCHTSILTLQMFISCRGMKVDLLDEDDEDYSEQAETRSEWHRHLRTTEPNYDERSLPHVHPHPRGDAYTDPFGVFVLQVSQSDNHVRNALGTRKDVRRRALLLAAAGADSDELIQLTSGMRVAGGGMPCSDAPGLKAVKHLSMNAMMLEVLQTATHWRFSSASRPARTALMCRKELLYVLWQDDNIAMYIKLCGPYFQVSAFEAIYLWLQDETACVEDALLKQESIDLLLECFVTSKANSFRNLLDPFWKSSGYPLQWRSPGP